MMTRNSLGLRGSSMWPDKTIIVAELSCNHRGSYDEAVALVEAAAKAGADAVKIQLYSPETMTLPMDTEPFQIHSGPWAGRTLWDLYSEARTPWSWAQPLQEVARVLGLEFIVSIYDPTALMFTEYMLDVWAYKIASFEITDLNLIRAVARTGKRVIISTGMATEDEILASLHPFTLLTGLDHVAVLHCVTAYPTPLHYMNLHMVHRQYQDRLHHVVRGLSDHSLSPMVPALAVAAGARIIEKHFTRSRANGAADATFSLEPDEFKEMVERVRETEVIMYGRVEAVDEAFYRRYRRSVHCVKDMTVGEVFTPENVRTLRGPAGMTDLAVVLGRTASRIIERGQVIQRGDIDD
ncbi:hypothetical protein LCGC14_0313290 [marine sediment metagenome]|uniref:SAF domain-containing protein n=1 Tax=marine sediment metagenome TaxID=412755 RepID=A0A0F9U425_9ZZZZ